jgi:hypothetical protein
MAVLESGGGNPSVNIINPGGVEGGVALEALVRVTQAARDRKLQREMNQAKMQQEQDMFQQEQNFAREQAAQASALQQQQFGLEEKRLGLDEKRVGLDQQQLAQDARHHDAEMQQRKKEAEERVILEQTSHQINTIDMQLRNLRDLTAEAEAQGNVEGAAIHAEEIKALETQQSDLAHKLFTMNTALTLTNETVTEPTLKQMLDTFNSQVDGKTMLVTALGADIQDAVMQMALGAARGSAFIAEKPDFFDLTVDPFGGSSVVFENMKHKKESKETQGLGKKALDEFKPLAQAIAKHVHGGKEPTEVENRLMRLLAVSGRVANDNTDEGKRYRASDAKLIQEDLLKLKSLGVDMDSLGDALIMANQSLTGSVEITLDSEGKQKAEMEEGGIRSTTGVSGEGSNSEQFGRLAKALKHLQFVKAPNVDTPGWAKEEYVFKNTTQLSVTPERIKQGLSDAILGVLNLDDAQEGINALLSLKDMEDDVRVFGKPMASVIAKWSPAFRQQLADTLIQNMARLDQKIGQQLPALVPGEGPPSFYLGKGQFNRPFMTRLEEQKRQLDQRLTPEAKSAALLQTAAKSKAKATSKYSSDKEQVLRELGQISAKNARKDKQ